MPTSQYVVGYPIFISGCRLLSYHYYISRFRLKFTNMRTTINTDDETLNKASRLTGIKEKTSLVRLGLQALIAQKSSKKTI